MKKIILVGLGVCSLLFAANDQRSFLIAPSSGSRPTSANELKEDIGEKLKLALFNCSDILSELGQFQRDFAVFQKRLLSLTEGLVENKPAFKNAKRTELAEALKIMSRVKTALHGQKDGIQKLSAKMNKSKCLT